MGYQLTRCITSMYHSNLTQAHNIHWLDWDIYLFSLNSVLLDWVIDTSLNETPSIRASTKLHPFWMGHRPKPSWFCTFELGYRYEQQHNIILFLKGNEIKMVFQKQPQPKEKASSPELLGINFRARDAWSLHEGHHEHRKKWSVFTHGHIQMMPSRRVWHTPEKTTYHTRRSTEYQCPWWWTRRVVVERCDAGVHLSMQWEWCHWCTWRGRQSRRCGGGQIARHKTQWRRTNLEQVRVQMIELGLWHLFKVIQGLDEEADMIRVLRVDEADRLMTIHTFDKLTMVEHILDIELVDWSMA